MGQHLSSFDAKVEWLIGHPLLVSSWPSWQADRSILQGMQRDGLISPGTHNAVDFSKVIAEARRRMRSRR